MNSAQSVTATFTASVSQGSGAWPPPVQLSTATSCVTTAISAPAGSTTYNVGPGKTYTSLTSVPWLSLKAGDVVNIYYQPTPYATIIAMTVTATAAAPVIINGVTDANCNRPILTGANAVVASDAVASNYWGQSPGAYLVGLGLINFAWAPNGPYPYPIASYINIQNLEITGTATGQHYTNASGASASWSASYGIYAVMFSHVNIENCLIHGNDGGVFFNSQDAPRTSSYVTLRGNTIYGNGRVGSYLEHNIYGQGYRTLYEGNWLGAEMDGAIGSTLKDRSSGTVIRNNYIVASQRAIDLVDSETDPTVIDDALYNYAWVYGNVIVDDFAVPGQGSGDLIHWGGDSTIYANYRVGTLYFYFNTVIVQNITSTSTQVGLFDMPLSSETVEAHSNVFYFENNAATYWPISLGICCGTINFDDANWVSTGYVTQNSNNGTGLVFHQNGTLLTGTSPLLNTNFTLSSSSGSPVIGRGVLAPTSVPSSAVNLANLQPSAQYGTTASTQTSAGGNPSIVARGTVTDLGAYAAQ
jgi:hypothetical protein